MNKVGNWLSMALVFALLVGAIVMGFVEKDTAFPNATPAPGFAFERFAGGKVDSEDLKGRVVMLDFWATWCPPCVEEMPMLVKVAKEYEAKGVTFVAVSHDDPETATAAITKFVESQVPDLRPFAVYGSPVTGARYKVKSLPTLFVIGRDGKIANSLSGEISERRLRSWLDDALAK